MDPTPRWQLERYLPVLRLQARSLQLDPRLQRRFDTSDLVQQTLLRAHRHLDQFRGQTEAELVRWLQEILANTAKDEVDKARAQKRDAALEQSLQAAVADSSARLEAFLAAEQSTPSEQAERNELRLRIVEALDQLPEEQRDVVIHHHLLGTPVARIAETMGRTEKSVAGLLYRAKRQLNELLQDCQ